MKRVVAELVDAREPPSGLRAYDRCKSYPRWPPLTLNGLVGLNPTNSFYNNQVALEMRI